MPAKCYDFDGRAVSVYWNDFAAVGKGSGYFLMSWSGIISSPLDLLDRPLLPILLSIAEVAALRHL